jgi:hypothetical protein
MSARRSDLEDHIKTLEEFETLYGEFLVERRNRERDWSGEEWARRERELKELAPQAEVAMRAAGQKRWDEGPVRIDLPARLLRFVEAGDGIDDADQWRILEGLPTNIGALKGKLRRTPDMGLKLWDAEAPPTPVAAPAPAAPQPSKRRAALAWIGEQAGKIAVGVVTALIVAAILFVVKGGS